MNERQRVTAKRIADLLDDDEAVWEFAVNAIAESRDKDPRLANDRDSGELLDDLIVALRNAI